MSATDGGRALGSRFVLFGSALDTGNLGVSALGVATVAALDRRVPGLDLTLFDNGAGVRPGIVEFPDRSLRFTQRGAWPSRRLYRSESLLTTYLATYLGSRLNGNLRAIDAADAVLDITGGDSFSDLYGKKRFAHVLLPKRIALRRQRPLILLPQTYGPFLHGASFATARGIVTGAAQAWARDAESFDQLRLLLGGEFDPRRHRLGVDVAFALPSREPAAAPAAVSGFQDWLDDGTPVVGVNVSGLLTVDAEAARSRFGLRADYPMVMEQLVGKLLGEGVRVLLVPHVGGGAWESDERGCERMMERMGWPEALRTLPSGLDASETKWFISHLDWFTGARMHATIAALSTSVPVAGVAYSDKARGVFATCGVADAVCDARELGSNDLLDALWASWQDRDQVRDRIRDRVPTVIQAAEDQFDDILAGPSGHGGT